MEFSRGVEMAEKLDDIGPSANGIEVEELEVDDPEAALEAARYAQVTEQATVGAEAGQLATAPLFRDLEPSRLQQIESRCQITLIPAGHVLIPTGQLNTKVLVVLDGQLRIVAPGEEKQIIGVIEPGNIVGLRSAIDQQPSSADFVASEPTRIAAIHYPALVEMAKVCHKLACNLVGQMASCLRADNYLRIGTNQNESNHTGLTDSLTGLHNGNWIRKMLPRQLASCMLDKGKLSIIVARLNLADNFNAAYGQNIKNTVLKSIAETLLNHTRSSGTLTREDSETFITLNPNETQSEAKTFIEKINRAVAILDIRDESGEIVPVPSLKWAILQQDKEEPVETIIAKAKSVATTNLGHQQQGTHLNKIVPLTH